MRTMTRNGNTLTIAIATNHRNPTIFTVLMLCKWWKRVDRDIVQPTNVICNDLS